MSYTSAIKKALGKRRMEKILEVDAYGMPLMVDIAMKDGWFYDGSETGVFVEWEGDPERETWAEFLRYIKSRVDQFEYKPELKESYLTLPPSVKIEADPYESFLYILSGLDDNSQTVKCGKSGCEYCGEE